MKIISTKSKVILTTLIMLLLMLLCVGCSVKPKAIFSERECEMPRRELAEVITNILKMNNFTITVADTNLISGVSNSDINFDFNPILNNRAKIEKYNIKWDFVISKSADARLKVVSTCYKVGNQLRANISTTAPSINYSENTFPVGKHYRRGRSDAMLYYSVIDALRHICGVETERYFDKRNRELRYDVAKNKFYRIE